MNPAPLWPPRARRDSAGVNTSMCSIWRRPSGHSYSRAQIGKLDGILEHGQVVRVGPLVGLHKAARGSPVALGLIAVALLQEGLVLALEVVPEHDVLEAGALGLRAIGATQVGSIEVRVVGQLARIGRAAKDRWTAAWVGVRWCSRGSVRARRGSREASRGG